MTINLGTGISWGVCLFLGIVVLVFGGILVYALRTKGYVSTELSHGKTSFKLEANERSPQKLR